MEQHTPGPWRSIQVDRKWIEFYQPDKDLVYFKPLPNHEANSKLKAAAPELLEVLQLIVDNAYRVDGRTPDDLSLTYEHVKKAKAIIKKVLTP